MAGKRNSIVLNTTTGLVLIVASQGAEAEMCVEPWLQVKHETGGFYVEPMEEGGGNWRNPGRLRLAEGFFDESAYEKRQTVYFETGRARVRPGYHRKLTALAKSGPALYLTGHADSRGGSEKNRSISQARAEQVRRALVAAGMAENRIGLTAYGEERPVCKEANAACLKRNRRVEIWQKTE